jgi:large subunit ribosomal protein L3
MRSGFILKRLRPFSTVSSLPVSASLRALLSEQAAATKVWPTKTPVLGAHQVVYAPPPPAAAAAPAGGAAWNPLTSRRVGVLALKAGMTADWDKWGVRHALTVLRLEDVIVTGVVARSARGYTALQVGAGHLPPRLVSRPLAGHFASVGAPPRRVLAEFRVSPDAVLPVGTPLLARHFVPGQMVTVSSVSQGKGFQGGMKRWGFRGGSASHGNSLSHRVLGATGCRQDPGRVFKGKKMPGQMGGDTITMDLQVYKLDVKNNLIYVRGAVAGKPGTYVKVKDSIKSPHRADAPPPFPSYALTDEDRARLAKWAANAYLSPLDELELQLKGALPKGARAGQAAPPLSLPLPPCSPPPHTHPHTHPPHPPAPIAEYEREPPFEIVMPPPAISPFAIQENEEGEEV